MARLGVTGAVDEGVDVARCYPRFSGQLLSAGSKKLRPLTALVRVRPPVSLKIASSKSALSSTIARSSRSSVPVCTKVMTSYFAAVPSIRCTRLPHCSRVVDLHGRPRLIMFVHHFPCSSASDPASVQVTERPRFVLVRGEFPFSANVGNREQEMTAWKINLGRRLGLGPGTC